jgi:DNA-binding NarL/FixJ family response regulator
MTREEICPIRVVIADDRPMFRQGLRGELDRAARIVVVGAVGDQDAVLRLLADRAPDVLTLGETLREVAGIDVAREVRRRFPAVAILMITARVELGFFQALRMLGVHGHLPRTADGEQIAAAVRIVARGGWIAEGDAGPEVLPAEVVPLTAREREVPRLLANGYRNAEIARLLSISPKTVDFHVGHLLAKLHARSRVEVVTTAQRLGLADSREAVGRQPSGAVAPDQPEDGRERARASGGATLGKTPGPDLGFSPGQRLGIRPVVGRRRAG